MTRLLEQLADEERAAASAAGTQGRYLIDSDPILSFCEPSWLMAFADCTQFCPDLCIANKIFKKIYLYIVTL